MAGSTAKFDLSFFLLEDADGFSGRVEYNTDLFDGSTIDRMLRHYQVLLEGALANPKLRLSQLPLLTREEREQTAGRTGMRRTAGVSSRALPAPAV